MWQEDSVMKCSRCGIEVLEIEAESCWYCVEGLCYDCWDKYGHCEHAEADEANERAHQVRKQKEIENETV